MALNIKVTNSCNVLVITASRYDITSLQANITITDLYDGGNYTAVLNYDAAGNGTVSVPVSSLSASYGAFKACLLEGNVTYVCKPILLNCDIDCCLVKLTNELIDCSCDCPRCASALAKAQKIFLLLKSAKSAVEIAGDTQGSGYFEDILSKYLKAKEICDNSCGCDC